MGRRGNLGFFRTFGAGCRIHKGIRSESQSTPVIRLAPSLPLTGFLRAFDCRDPSPDRQGARGSAEVSGLALSLLWLPDGSCPQPLRAALSRSALAGSGCRNQASRATVWMRESAMPASDIHRAATGNGAAESKTHNPPRREPTGDRLCSRRRARLAPGAQTMPVSGDTLLRVIHSAPLPDFVAPTVVGIDDWAWRRGQRYGTIICDLERNCVLELLPDRNADSVASCLKRWPGIKVVARDRAGLYADDARCGGPDAVQVADRWHLFNSLGEALRHTGRHRHNVAAARPCTVAGGSKGCATRMLGRNLPSARAGLPDIQDRPTARRRQAHCSALAGRWRRTGAFRPHRP